MTTSIPQAMHEIARHARAAARRVAALDADTRTRILQAMADGITAGADGIARINADDMARAREAGLSAAMLDRLRLDGARNRAMADAVRAIATLPDPVGVVLEENRRPNGLVIRKVRVPLGVVLIIYESRPNVTADAAAVCLKAGNAVILKGGSEALATNRAIVDAMQEAGAGAGLPEGAVQLVPTADRAAVRTLLACEDEIDLVIPRGGEGLIRAVAEQSRVPVLKHYKGVCHVYVDASADLEMAAAIVENAKCQRPGVCNALETLLVHEDVATRLLPGLAERLHGLGVELRGDEATRAIARNVTPATEDDWSAEYLDLILAVRVVPDLDSALDHIECYGSRHSDAIVTTDDAHALRFTAEVDSATVYVNASTRFTDGGMFGMGAEIGISTDKLHARGPCGVNELTTYKYVIEGAGQIRG